MDCTDSGDTNIEEKEAIVQEVDSSSIEQSFVISETEWAAVKALLDKRYAEIATLLRYNKTKDESIQRLSAEVQKYREGFAFSALKPFINALISLREDCRKSVRDAKQFPLDGDKAKKYIDYLVSDLEEMLGNIGLERADDSISINGKPLSGLTSPKEPPAAPVPTEQKSDEAPLSLVSPDSIKNTTELIDYLNKSENAIRLALKDRAAADKTIQEYAALAARTDAEHYFALAAPIARKLYELYDKLSAASRRAAGELSGDAFIELYNKILNGVIKGTGIILTTNAGMTIETLDGLFDTQKHKILKAIPTADENLDRTVATIYTDCYSCEGKIVYQSKVDVYKFQQN